MAPRALEELGASFKRILKSGHEHDVLAVAAGVAFEFFLSLVPLLVVMGYIIGNLVRRRGLDAVLLPLLETAPVATQSIVREELQRLATANSAPAPLAVLGFLWASSASVHVVMTTVEKIEHRAARPWWKKRLMACGWIVAFLAIVTANAWALVEWQDVVRSNDSRPAAPYVGHGPAHATESVRGPSTARSLDAPVRRGGQFWRGSKTRRAVTLGSSLVLATVMLALFFQRATARPTTSLYRPWPGALCTVLVWLIASWLFGIYVAQLGTYALYYGSLATVAVMLLWLWIGAFAILVGAEVNAELAHDRAV